MRGTGMTVFVSYTPADVFSMDELDILDAGGFALLSAIRWRTVIVRQDSDTYRPGEPAEIVADLGVVPAWCRDTGDPDWGPLDARFEVAGFDVDGDNARYYPNELVPHGIWHR